MLSLLQSTSVAATMAAPMSLSNIFLGLNTLTCLAIVWGGGRLLGKMETKIEDGDKLNAEAHGRFLKLLDDIEQRVGYLEGRRG